MKKLSLIILALLLATPVLAVDFYQGPPPGTWQRGEPGTTFQHWTFEEIEYDGSPTISNNVFGNPVFDLMGEFEHGQWECPPEMDPHGFVNGWHCINPEGGAIVLRIPNTEMTNGEKTIFIQITSSKAPSDVQVEGFGSNPDGYATRLWPTGVPHVQWGQPAPYGGMWYTYVYGFVISPNPQEETITFHVPYCTVIDQIVVDTICTGTVATEIDTMDGIKALYR